MTRSYLSKLCKENKSEACTDCLSLMCICVCHKLSNNEEITLKQIFDDDFFTDN